MTIPRPVIGNITPETKMPYCKIIATNLDRSPNARFNTPKKMPIEKKKIDDDRSIASSLKDIKRELSDRKSNIAQSRNSLIKLSKKWSDS